MTSIDSMLFLFETNLNHQHGSLLTVSKYLTDILDVDEFEDFASALRIICARSLYHG